jgi:PilZ domain
MNSARLSSPRPSFPVRRQDPRFPITLPVTLLSTRPNVELVTWDVSFRGMYLLTAEPQPERRLVRLAIVSPANGERLVFHGMVANVVDVGDPGARLPGMGVELFAVDPETRAAWWSLVRFVRDHLTDAPSGVHLVPSPAS